MMAEPETRRLRLAKFVIGFALTSVLWFGSAFLVLTIGAFAPGVVASIVACVVIFFLVRRTNRHDDPRYAKRPIDPPQQ